MMKKCICKNGKTDPQCPACNQGDVNLDSFHRLNPEARPLDAAGKAKARAVGGKTAEQFKVAFPANLLQRASGSAQTGLGALKTRWNGLTPETRGHITEIGKSAIMPAAAGALAGGITAEPGQTMAGMFQGGLLGGTLGAGVSAADRLTPPTPKVASQFYELGKEAALTAFSL